MATIAMLALLRQGQHGNGCHAVVSCGLAHKYLEDLSRRKKERIEISSAASQGEFDWKGYVANRSVEQLELVVGDGITCFEARFLAALDKNMKQNRFDFVAHRRDGSCVRFHPSAKKDAMPIYGNLQDWALTADAGPLVSKRIAVPAQVPGASRGSSDMYETLSQADTIPSESFALMLLHMHEHVWRGEGGKFATDLRLGLLAKSPFLYNLYLTTTCWGREIARIGVTSFWVVWVGGHWNQPGFYVKYGQNEGVLFPHKKDNPYLEAVPDIMWHI